MSSYTSVKTVKYGPFLVHPVRDTLCNDGQHVSAIIRNTAAHLCIIKTRHSDPKRRITRSDRDARYSKHDKRPSYISCSTCSMWCQEWKCSSCWLAQITCSSINHAASSILCCLCDLCVLKCAEGEGQMKAGRIRCVFTRHTLLIMTVMMIIIIICLYYSQVKPLIHNRLSRSTAMIGLTQDSNEKSDTARV